MSSAKIVEVSVTPHAIPIRVPFAIATETLPEAKLLIVRVKTTGSHFEGVGEAAPFPSLTFDTVESAQNALMAWVTSLYHKTIPEALAFLHAEAPNLRAKSMTAHAALEMALYDLQAKHWGTPLRHLFGSANLPTIETDITVPLMAVSDVEGFFRSMAPRDLRVIKIKVKGDVAADLALVEEVARCVTTPLKFSIDGNQGFNLERALALCAALKSTGLTPDFFEQPFPLDDWESCHAYMRSPPVRLCLDETIKTPQHAIRAVKENACHMINLKVMKSGVRYMHDIAIIARAAGLDLMIGGMLESDVAMGFSLQFAAGFGGITAVDLDTPYFFTRQLTETSAWGAGTALLKVP